MNADEVLLRLKAFALDMRVLVAVPTATGNRLLPIVAVHHHGLDPDAIDHERGGVEIFTTPWDDPPQPPYATVMIQEIISRIAQHREDTHVRIGVPVPHHEGGAHHRILHVDLVGFGSEPSTDGKLSIELVTEHWDALAQIIRMDAAPEATVDGDVPPAAETNPPSV